MTLYLSPIFNFKNSRKLHFFEDDSIKVSSKSFKYIFRGTPGKPAPLPTSASSFPLQSIPRSSKHLARVRESTKCLRTISFLFFSPTRLWTLFHLKSSLRYRENFPS